MFLIRDNKQKVSAHHWDGHDTACKMWSTGGMNKDHKWSVHAGPGNHSICTMCANVHRKGVEVRGNDIEPGRGPQ